MKNLKLLKTKLYGTTLLNYRHGVHLPCPISVWAYVPRISKFVAASKNFSRCSGLVWSLIVVTNMGKCIDPGWFSLGNIELKTTEKQKKLGCLHVNKQFYGFVRSTFSERLKYKMGLILSFKLIKKKENIPLSPVGYRTENSFNHALVPLSK